MAEESILFNTEMVKAILDGRKTQTRRPVMVYCHGGNELHYIDDDGVLFIQDEYGDCHKLEDYIEGPFGRPGDRLWVRETWQVVTDGDCDAVFYRASSDGNFNWCKPDGSLLNITINKWRPSTHMPRWASRINLLVKRVWIERLQDISGGDIYSEALPNESFNKVLNNESHAADEMRKYWNKIYKAKGFGWDSNPFCWCCEFTVIDSEVKDGI